MLELTNAQVRQHLLAKVKPRGKGRKPGVPNFSAAERLFMGVSGVINGVAGTQEKLPEVGEHGEVSQPTVNNAMNGKVGKRKDEDLQEGIDMVLGASRALGSGLLFRCLELVKNEDLEDMNAKQLVQTADQVGSVLKKIEKKEAKESDQRSQVVFYVPKRDKPVDYDVIDVWRRGKVHNSDVFGAGKRRAWMICWMKTARCVK